MTSDLPLYSTEFNPQNLPIIMSVVQFIGRFLGISHPTCKDINQLKGNGLILLESGADDITIFWPSVCL